MRQLIKMIVIVVGGTGLLMILSAVFSSMLGLSMEKVHWSNLAADLLYFRLGLYAVLIATWPYITKGFAWIVYRRNPEATSETVELAAEKLGRKRSQVGCLFLVFELVFVQQLGAHLW